MTYIFINIRQAVLDLENAEKINDTMRVDEIKDAIERAYRSMPPENRGGKRKSRRNKKTKRKSRRNKKTNRRHR